MYERLLPWLVRAAWAGLPFAAGPALAAALDERSPAVQDVATVGLWAGWTAALAASLVLHPVTLTVVRIATPSAVAAVAVAAGLGEPSPAGFVVALLAFGASFLPETAMAYVNGAAYAGERRFPLRVPTPLLFGPLLAAWLLTVGPPVAAALLLAARQWVAGGLVTAAAGPLTWLLARSLHGLSRRWLVFVPAGVVLHDPTGLADPVLFRRQDIARLRPAAPLDELGDGVINLGQRAYGLTVQLELHTPAPIAPVRPGRRGSVEQFAVLGVRFVPTRPGAVLAEAAARHLPVG